MRIERYANTICDLWRQAQQESTTPDGFDAVCNLACERNLWRGVGERLLDFLSTEEPDLAVNVWHGSADEIQKWLSSGRSDLAITHRAISDSLLSHKELNADQLVLVSTDPKGESKFDPGYVFIEHGETFGREHAAAYADADTARVSFNDVATGLQHIKNHGGSAYLPARAIGDDLNNKTLFIVADAPTFDRRVLLSVNRHAQRSWPWFERAISHLQASDMD